jgi:hypothetical protein
VAEHRLELDLIGGPAWSCSCETVDHVTFWHRTRTVDAAIDQWHRHMAPPELDPAIEADIERLRDRGLL